MPLISKVQLGIGAESTYGTPVTPTRFFEFVSEGLQEQRGRIESKGLRAATRVQRADRFVPYSMGAAGPITFEPLTKGFGIWLQYMLGSVASAGPTDSKYTYTGTIGDLHPNKSFTAQVNRPFHPGDTDRQFTYHGGKVTSWQFSNDVDGLLQCTLNCDFEDVDTSTALASASYPTSAELFSFVGATITVGGSSFDVGGITIGMDNKVKTDRRYLRSSALKKEPVEADFREITWELRAADFDSLTQYNRFISATASGALTSIVATWTAPTLIGSAAYPTMTVTVDQARFDMAAVTVGGPDPLQQRLSGRGLFSSSSALTVAYGTADSTA